MKLKPLKDQIILPVYMIVGVWAFLMQAMALLGGDTFPFFEIVFRSIFWIYHLVIWIAPYITEGFINSFQ